MRVGPPSARGMLPRNGATDLRLELSRRSVGLGGRVAFVAQEKRQLRIDWQRVRLVPQVETALVRRDEQDVVVRIVRGKVDAPPRRLLEPQRHQLFVVVPANRADRRTGVRTIDTRHKQIATGLVRFPGVQTARRSRTANATACALLWAPSFARMRSMWVEVVFSVMHSR